MIVTKNLSLNSYPS